MLGVVTSGVGPWFRTLRHGTDGEQTVVCFHHAGGSASSWFPLVRALPASVGVLAAQYPGRHERMDEPASPTIVGLSADLADALSMAPEHRTVFLGHSMGALVAYEVTLRLAERGMPQPAALVVSGRRAPSRYQARGVESVHSDAEIIAWTTALGGIDARVFEIPELRGLVLKLLRADLAAVRGYRHEVGRVVDSPIVVLRGDQDPLVEDEDAQAWAHHTRGTCSNIVVPGGHFFLNEHLADIAALLRRSLVQAP